MWEFCYWLFPLIALLFFFMPLTRAALLPGLLAACIAGAANSMALEKPQFAWLHAAAGALLVCVAVAYAQDTRLFLWSEKSTKAKGRDARQSATTLRFRESWLGALIWALLAALVIGVLPDSMWPYELSKTDMLQLYVMFLPVGALALSSPDL